MGLMLAARGKDGAGRLLAQSPEELAGKIVDQLTRQSAEVILAACLVDDGVAGVDTKESIEIDRALRRKPGIIRFGVTLDRPLVGLGASAPVYYPAIAEMLAAESSIPGDADVANAIGAVVGQVRASVTVFVTSPDEGIFVVNGAGVSVRLTNQDESFALARERAAEAALEQARLNGADEPVLDVRSEVDAPEIEGSRKLIEARFIATASGRPRIANG